MTRLLLPDVPYQMFQPEVFCITSISLPDISTRCSYQIYPLPETSFRWDSLYCELYRISDLARRGKN